MLTGTAAPVSAEDARQSVEVQEKKKSWFAWIGEFLFSPGSYFSGLRDRPVWLPAFLVAGTLSMVMTAGLLPFTVRGLQTSIPGTLTHIQAATMMRQIELGKYLGVVLTPVLLLFKNAIGAVLITILLQLFIGRGDFKRAFALVNHLAILSLLPLLQTIVVLYIRGVDSIRNPMDMAVPLGLNLFISSASPALDTLLNSVNMYEALSVSFLIVGIRRLFRSSGVGAACVAALYWSLATATVVSFSVLAHALQPTP